MSQNSFEEAAQPFISHLIELRNRLLKVILCVLVVFLGLAGYANQIYSILAGPLMKHMPKNSTMIAIDVASPFFTPFKLALVVAVFISVPVILYQFWAFVAPGLYKRERRMILPLLIASTVLFYLGVAFAYFVVFPLVFGFLTAAAPVGVAVMTDITKYLDFVLTLFFAFGLCFVVPIFRKHCWHYRCGCYLKRAWYYHVCLRVKKVVIMTILKWKPGLIKSNRKKIKNLA